MTLEPSRLGADTLEEGTIEASLDRGDLTVRTRLLWPAGRLTLAGTARPFDSIPTYSVREGAFQGLELGKLLRRPSLRTALSGSLRLEASGREAKSARLDGTITVDSSIVNRTVIRGGRLQLALADGRARIVGGLRGDGDSITIDGTAEPFATPRRVHLTSQIGIADLAALLGRDTIDAGGAARIVVEGELGRPEATRLRGTIRGNGHFAGISVDSLRADGRLAAGLLDLDTLAIRSNVAHLTGGGRVALYGPDTTARSAFRLGGSLRDLAPLGPVLGIEGLAVDSGRVDLRLDGPKARTHLEADLQATHLALGPRRARAVHASLDGSLAADRSIAAGTGSIVMENVTVPGRRIGRLRVDGSYGAQQLAVRGHVELDRLRTLTLAARAYPATAERRVELDTLVVRGDKQTWALRHPVRMTYGQRIAIQDFALVSGGRRIGIDGIVDRRGEQRMTVAIDSLPVAWLSELLGSGTTDGEINGRLDLTGPATAPKLAGTLAVGLTSRGKKVGTARAGLDWIGARGLRLDVGVYHPEGDSLRVTGRVPLALSLASDDSSRGVVSRIPAGELTMDAVANGFRIDMLQPLLDPKTAKSLRGRLTVDAHARGSLESPALSGSVELTEARIEIPRLGATYDNGHMRATLEGRNVRLNEARFEAGGGRLDGKGVISVQEAQRIGLDLDATMQDFRLADGDNLGATTSGRVHLGGTPKAPSLEGAVKVRNLDYYLQAKSLGQSAEAVELTAEDLRILEDRFGVTADQSVRGAPSPWAMNLDLTLSGNDWLRRRTSPVVAVELSGNLQIRKAAGEDMQIFGAIQPLAGRSFVELLGRRFQVTSGQVGLNGPMKNARLNLLAEYRADSGSSSTSPSGVVITTQLKADTGQLAVTLDSRPKLSDADIRSYLATGRPAGTDPTRANDETNPLTAGASLAVGAALGTVAGGAGRALGFDVVQILQDRNGGQTLVAGKYVSPPSYLGFREPIVAAEDPSEPQSSRGTMEWEVEYAALRRALLNLQGSGEEFRAFLRLRR